MIIQDNSIKIAAGELFSAALLDVFPQTQVVEVAHSPLGFTLEARVFQPIDPFAVKLIQERFAFLQRQSLIIEPIEMMRENAANLFRHRGQRILAERAIEASENIISLVRIGNFYGYNTVEEAAQARETGEIEILNYNFAGEVLIFNVAVCPDKQAKKLFCKKYKEHQKNDYRILAEKRQLFFESTAAPGTYVWLKKGISLREQILEEWKNRFEEASYEPISFPNNEREEFSLVQESAAHYGKCPLRIADVSIDAIRGYHFCNRKDLLGEMISSLQFLDQSINMLGIEYRYHLVAPREEILVQALKAVRLDYTISQEKSASKEPVFYAYGVDSLGREWKAAMIKLLSVNDEWMIKLAILAPLEWQVARK